MLRARSLLLGGCLLVAVPGAGCSRHVDEPSSDFKPAQGAPPPPAPTRLEIEDTAPGSGREARTGDTVRVQYTGTLLDGTKFDSSHDRHDEPFKFTLGQGQVIQGWDQGVVGMKVGGKRRLRIPSELAYGKSGHPPAIPPDSALVFDIELVSIE
jgi:FKBP-type peptidyl-prolyl cis-trans isomerase